MRAEKKIFKMKYANNINIRVFCKKDENYEEILKGLLKISGFSIQTLEKEKLKIKKTEAKGFEEKIMILELFLDKDRHINKVLKNMNQKLSKNDKDILLKEKNRLDDNLDFFIRLSKPLILENVYELTNSGDCYHIKINIAAFPKNQESANKIISEMF